MISANSASVAIVPNGISVTCASERVINGAIHAAARIVFA